MMEHINIGHIAIAFLTVCFLILRYLVKSAKVIKEANDDIYNEYRNEHNDSDEMVFM